MKLFPPNPKNVGEATEYVRNIPRRTGKSDYQAIREAGTGPLGIAPMFFVFMVNSADDFTLLSTLLSVGFALFGAFCLLLGHRTLQLLDLFPNSDLPTLDPDRLEVSGDTPKKT